MKKHTITTGLLALLAAIALANCTAPAPATQAPVEPTATQVPIEPTATMTPAPTAPPIPWELALQTKVKQPVRIAAFLDKTFGITGGATGAGKANHTTDGGETWTLAEDSGGCIYGLDIVDEQSIWACGRMTGQSFSTPGGIRMSADGGQTWGDQADYQTTPGLCQLSFLDTQTGWVSNGGQLSATADGGATWKAITLPDDVAEIAAISLRTPNDGYVLDYDGNLYITSNGGEEWLSLAVGMERYGEMSLAPFQDLATAAMRFFDADHGVVVLSLAGGGSKLAILRTTDGGQTWEEDAVPEGIDIGVPYLTRDGEFLTISSLLKVGELTVLHYARN